MRLPYQQDGTELFATVSIGASVYPLHAMVAAVKPKVSRIAVLMNPESPTHFTRLQSTEAAANTLGVAIVPVGAGGAVSVYELATVVTGAATNINLSSYVLLAVLAFGLALLGGRAGRLGRAGRHVRSRADRTTATAYKPPRR